MFEEVNEYPFDFGGGGWEIIGMVTFWELNLEVRVIDDVVYFLQVLFVLTVLALEDEFEELEVKDYLVGVRIVMEYFNLALIVH